MHPPPSPRPPRSTAWIALAGPMVVSLLASTVLIACEPIASHDAFVSTQAGAECRVWPTTLAE